MRVFFLSMLCLALQGFSYSEASSPSSSKPVKDLQVTLRGAKYDVSDVATVEELKERVVAQASPANGNTGGKDHHVLFGGKRLPPTAFLRDSGVSDGAQLNMVPATAASSNKKKSDATGAAATATASSTSESANAMKDYLQKAGVDSEKLDELMKSMGGGEGGAPSMKESLDMMQNMMNSPIFQEYMNNPEMLEQSRKMILNNPMLKSMMGEMPGMSDLLEDPEAWREAMQAAANLYKNMDSEQLQSMLGGLNGADLPTGAGGLFDGTMDNSAATAALDELDEDD